MYTYEKKNVKSKAVFPTNRPSVIQGKFSGELESISSEEIMEVIEKDYNCPPSDEGKNRSMIDNYRNHRTQVYERFYQIADLLNLQPIYRKEEIPVIIEPLYKKEKLPSRQQIIESIYTHYGTRFSNKSIVSLVSGPEFSMDLQNEIHKNVIIFHASRQRTLKDQSAQAEQAASQSQKELEEYIGRNPPYSEKTGDGSSVPAAPDVNITNYKSQITKSLSQKKTCDRDIQTHKKEEDRLNVLFKFLPQIGKEIKSIPGAGIEKFMLRHYTTVEKPQFTSIRSALSLGIEKADIGKKSSGHTNDSDWNTFGNIGNTFFLLFINGNPVCRQNFLLGTKHYTEVPLANVPYLWFSNDWLNPQIEDSKAFQGSGREAYLELLRIAQNASAAGLTDAAGLIAGIERVYCTLEVKIPGSVPIGSEGWKPSDFFRKK